VNGLRGCSQTPALIGHSHFSPILHQSESKVDEMGGFDWFTFSNWKSPPISVQEKYKITERLNVPETISISQSVYCIFRHRILALF